MGRRDSFGQGSSEHWQDVKASTGVSAMNPADAAAIRASETAANRPITKTDQVVGALAGGLPGLALISLNKRRQRKAAKGG